MTMIEKCPVCGLELPALGFWGKLADCVGGGVAEPSFSGVLANIREEDRERVMVTFGQGIAIMGHLALEHGIHLDPDELTVLADGEDAVRELITRKLIAK